jgi:plastocyanin
MTLSACGTGGPAYHPPLAHAAAVVDMGFMSFRPAVITVHRGETVEWRNTSVLTHTVTQSPQRGKKKTFDSGDIAAGHIYMHTFNAAGTYHYFCEHHKKHGMTGTVVVGK